MQKNSTNIIRLKKENIKWNKVESDSEVTTMANSILFKNANLVCIETGETSLCDIFVENGLVKTISKAGKLKEDCANFVEDLEGDFVLPSFYNAFVDSGNWLNIDKNADEQLLSELMGLKDVLSGATRFLDSGFENVCVLRNVADMDENQLNDLSDYIAKNNCQVCLKVGQSLEELGTVDKKFGKSLPLVLEDFGFLDRDFLLVGGNCLEKDDLQIFAEHGNRFVVCPSEDGLLGRRPTNLITLKNMGFEIRIGSGSAFEIDFFAFMRQILMTQWGMFEDCTCLTEKDVLLMATDGVSTVKEGDFANFIVVRNLPNIYTSILQNLVWGKSKKDVCMTVYHGRVLQRYGNIFSGKSGMDYFTLMKEINKKLRRNEK